MGHIRLPSSTPQVPPFLNDADHPEHVEKQASYPGEDTSYTTQRELNGWYDSLLRKHPGRF